MRMSALERIGAIELPRWVTHERARAFGFVLREVIDWVMLYGAFRYWLNV